MDTKNNKESTEILVEENENKLGWKGLVLCGIIGYFIISILLSAVLLPLIYSYTGTLKGDTLNVYLIITNFIIIIWSLHLLKCNTLIILKIKPDMGKFWKMFGTIILLLIGIILFEQSMTWIFSGVTGIEEEAQAQADKLFTGNIVLSFIGIVVLAPITEEILFRAVIFGGLRQRYGFIVSAIISAIIFGVMHGGLWAFIQMTLIGMILALLYEKTGKIIYPIIFHGLNNFIAFMLDKLSIYGDEIDIELENVGFEISSVVLIVSLVIICITYCKLYHKKGNLDYLNFRKQKEENLGA